MDVITMLVAAVFAILTIIANALSQQIADEFKAWTPRLVAWIMESAVRRLPEEHQERFREEWLERIESTPGHVGKLIEACRYHMAALRWVRAPSKMKIRLTRFLYRAARRIDEDTERQLIAVDLAEMSQFQREVIMRARSKVAARLARLNKHTLE